ncbi:hypothetical protein T10_2465 [Trichinella papuae]|uniref:Uncharacterized protein n=1 Tax=Trichinella papuae TaxID=268474 RepID=A0A0V1M1B0_9BILA|nr:hypothetical protein T10_2465 [Trichinella papuae]
MKIPLHRKKRRLREKNIHLRKKCFLKMQVKHLESNSIDQRRKMFLTMSYPLATLQSYPPVSLVELIPFSSKGAAYSPF